MPDKFSAVVIGSGFGGTISALTLAKSFAKKNEGKKPEDKETVCILERGQWWVSHEIPYKAGKSHEDQNILEYLVDTKKPFNFWAHPDNIEGLFNMISMSRLANKRGLYDFHHLSKNVNVVTASGVGGGSLVYSNVTIRPHKEVYENWPKEKPEDDLDKVFEETNETYFSKAEKFIGVNKITTNAGLAGQMLERSQIFQKATDDLAKKSDTKILNKGDYSLNLSITDQQDRLFDLFDENAYKIDAKKIKREHLMQLPSDLISSLPPSLAEKLKPEYLSTISPSEIEQLGTNLASALGPEIIKKYQDRMQTNVCQRQARCNIGCIPGARHTLNKRLFQAMHKNQPLEVRALCEATKIEYDESDKNYPYLIKYNQFNIETGKLEAKEIKAAILVVSSGTLGSTELLKNSEVKGKLEFSSKLGERFSTNADLLAYMELKTKQVDNTRGPINTSHAEFKTDNGKFGFNIEDTAIPPIVSNVIAMMLENPSLTKGIGFMQSFKLIRTRPSLIGSLFFKKSISSKIMKNMLKWFLEQKVVQNLISQPIVVKDDKVVRERDENTRKEMTGLYTIANWILSSKERLFDSPAQRLSKFFIFSCMGIDNSDGTLRLRSEEEKKFQIGSGLALDWKPENNEKIFHDIMKGVRELADTIEQDGSATVKSPSWNEGPLSESNLILLHPLGGCSIGNTIDDGVVNCYGEVFKPNSVNKKDTYRDFYVVDGSIIPMAVGVNPSLTIMALAFRCAEKMVETKEYWP